MRKACINARVNNGILCFLGSCMKREKIARYPERPGAGATQNQALYPLPFLCFLLLDIFEQEVTEETEGPFAKTEKGNRQMFSLPLHC